MPILSNILTLHSIRRIGCKLTRRALSESDGQSFAIVHWLGAPATDARVTHQSCSISNLWDLLRAFERDGCRYGDL